MEDWQVNKSLIEANNYMLQNAVASDVTFLVGENKDRVRAHRFMLMSRSPMCLELFHDHMERAELTVNLPDVRVETFKDVLTYVYTDHVDLHGENVTSLLYVARKFLIKGLSDMCFKYLETGMSVGSVCKIMEQANMYSETGLYDKCLQFILDNGYEVLKTHSFNELPADCVRDILQSDNLKATEELIYEAMVVWSTNECRRQKKASTDENRREVLGPLLYLIRFPTMDVTYFTQRVSFRDILSHDESVSIFQYFHGEERQLSSSFNKNERNRLKTKRSSSKQKKNQSKRQTDIINVKTSRVSPNRLIQVSPTPRIPISPTPRTRDSPALRKLINTPIPIAIPWSPNMSRVARFRTYDGQWQQNGPPDAISFSCSSPIVLYGIEIFGAAKGSETYNLKLFLFDDMKEEVRTNDARITTDTIRREYDVMFARPVRVPSMRIFTVMVMMKGSPTNKGVDGSAVHVADGVTFEFSNSNRSSNGTDVTVGQIPALLFNKTD